MKKKLSKIEKMRLDLKKLKINEIKKNKDISIIEKKEIVYFIKKEEDD
jgi:hypothetical protein